MIVFLALFIPAAVFAGCIFRIYRFGFYSPVGDQNDDFHIASTPQMNERRDTIMEMIRDAAAIPFEPVSITSHDGLVLQGRYYHMRDSAPLDICFHGYRGTPCRDFSGGIQVMRREGHNILMAEQRAHCGSQGHTITLGIEERFDCLDWIRYAADRFGPDTEILLSGISMGASTVLMAASLSLPAQVRGIIADCPFTSPEAIVRKLCRDRKLPAAPVSRLAGISARLLGRFDLTAASAADAVKASVLPILLIHGEEDLFVPCSMSREICEAAEGRAELHLFPGAGHGISCLLDPDRYERIVREFSRNVLSDSVPES